MSNFNISGQMNFNSLGESTKQLLVDIIYPVGSYYITESQDFDTVEKVQEHFGGNWERLNSRFLYATSDPSAVGHEDGEASHTLTLDEMPSHKHVVQANLGWGDGGYGDSWGKASSNNPRNPWGTSCSNAGGNKAHNNMPPYRKVLMYRRIG